MNKPNLDARLLAAAKFVREGAYACDIGTDHAYLPVYLVLIGRASRALAPDINKGPVMRAKESVAKYGVNDKIDVVLSDGLRGAEGYPVTDIIIAGMGGELIAHIVESAPHLRDKSVRLILQPMSRQEHLRRALYRLGYFIVGERYSLTDGKRYVCICAEFSGNPCEISEELANLGPDISHDEDREAYLAYLTAKRDGLAKVATAKREAGICDGTENILALFDARIQKQSNLK